jgi:hypothetical protein
MKHSSSGQPPLAEPENNSLNPHLQQALSCLDVKLEDELDRFRQQQQVESFQVNEETWLQHPSERESDSSILSAEIIPGKMPATPLEKGDYEVLPPSEGFGIAPEIPQPKQVSFQKNPDNYGTVVTHAEDLALPPEELDLNFSTAGAIAPYRSSSNQYSASAQELLRQIQAEETTSPTPAVEDLPQPKRKFLTPLRVGSIAALCLAAGGAVYTYLNPSVLAPLTGTKVATVVAPTSTTPQLGQTIQSPNLAANEFTQIDLSTLNTIQVKTNAPSPNVVQTATTATTTATATNPVAVPYQPQKIAPPGISQPQIADSLVKSLLPNDFQQLAQQYQKIRNAKAGEKKVQ